MGRKFNPDTPHPFRRKGAGTPCPKCGRRTLRGIHKKCETPPKDTLEKLSHDPDWLHQIVGKWGDDLLAIGFQRVYYDGLKDEAFELREGYILHTVSKDESDWYYTRYNGRRGKLDCEVKFTPNIA